MQNVVGHSSVCKNLLYDTLSLKHRSAFTALQHQTQGLFSQIKQKGNLVKIRGANGPKHNAPASLGHFIKDIDRGSPAEAAGLRDMDRLVAVNEQEVESLGHEQVVDRIRQCGESCSVLVVSEETAKMYKMVRGCPHWGKAAALCIL